MKYFFLLFALFLGTASFAQQDPHYTQFMFNKLYFNPAYAGSKGMLSISGLYRKQWIGMKGAPQSQTINIHAPFFKQKMALGLSVTGDQIGLFNSWNVEGSYAYRIPIKESFLSIGIRGSANFMRMRWDGADPTQLFDAAIPNAGINRIVPNFGFGIYYDAPTYFVGFSIPHMFNSKIDFTGNNGFTGLEPRLERHFFLMGGLIFDIAKNVKFQPAVMFKYVPRSPFDMDLNVSFVFFEKLWTGVTYRLGDSIDAVLQYAFSPFFKIGASYDFTLTRLQQYNSGSIEVMVEFCIGGKSNHKMHNPRRFF